jgi:hypothetical protein
MIERQLEEEGVATQERQQRIMSEVSTWPGVVTQPHRFGGIEFRLGKREIGHFHGDSLLDVPFPLRVKEELVAAGEAEEHHILPESGWISYRIRSNDDIEHAVELLHRSFELAVESSLRKAADSRATTLKEHRE